MTEDHKDRPKPVGDTPLYGRHAPIPAETRLLIVEALQKKQPTKDIVRKFGCSRSSIYKIARENNISLLNTAEVTELLDDITGGRKFKWLAGKIDVSYGRLRDLISMPELISSEWVRDILAPKLKTAFPGREQQIAIFISFFDQPRLSAAQIKRGLIPAPEARKEARRQDLQAIGTLLAEWRENCNLTQPQVRTRLKVSVVAKNLEKIEAGDNRLNNQIYSTAIAELCMIYAKLTPAAEATRYRMQLNQIGARLNSLRK